MVPNPSLLDNHQAELAEELARQGYVVHGELSGRASTTMNGQKLAAALEESEELRKKQSQWPPVNSGEVIDGKGIARVMDEEVGFLLD